MKHKSLDLVCFGRSSVDLYGQQVGGRLENMGSFAKYVGGSPANTAIGTARLGLKSGMITRVGDEHMGRFIRETMQAEGVDVQGIKTDPERLSALVILGIQDEGQFPLIFYREDCADMALCEADIDEDLIASSRALLLSGTHLSTPTVAAASRKAIALAKKNDTKVVLDIDYRPNLWGLAGHGDGESRFIADANVSQHVQSFLPDIDLIVGTEEEFHIAAGCEDSLEALAIVRAMSMATLVCKRGEQGCRVFEGDIKGWLSGSEGPGFKVEVYNVLGAGDAFMSGLLRGWLGGEDWPTSCAYANACGAFAVSRHGCAPAVPSWQELEYFLEHGSEHHALRFDPVLNHIHRTTNRRKQHERLVAFAIDHRHQFTSWAQAAGKTPAHIDQFKQLAVQAAVQEAGQDSGFGMLVDDRTGRSALHQITSTKAWVGRPIESSGVFPLRLEAEGDIVQHLFDWPLNQTVKVLCPYRLDDDAATRQHHEELMIRLDQACRFTGHQWLLEIITARDDNSPAFEQVAPIMQYFYKLGVKPDWWKLEPALDPAYWRQVGEVIDAHDSHCQGIIVLGLNGTIEGISEAFYAASKQPWVKGFAIGRTLFAEAAQGWLQGHLDDAQAIKLMATNYRLIIAAWDNAQAQK
ncbi:bifunctional 5-dehydro-2-deoxygluconokinase/5-dehydro-2-deoxyphosphogluconate aldolase [Candidatus Njordibacter sp. Uisw_058]|uniref:bifunctional 5-dehydro-2-deoxygluconokinase/5-dehydro-2- deoxyphosphogluconate aldolase n=1 Tax=Candidatus Njordibacter sp. Uisw_058 TaxID=3230974 RepID=UPI003D38D855